jgi:hypothetical protein
MYILYTDNWYTSFSLIVAMLKIGMHVVGTAKANVQGTPTQYQYKKKGAGKAERGHMMQAKADIPGTGLVYYTSWMDKKPVNVMATFATTKDEVIRNAKRAKTNEWYQLSIDRPTVVKDYNHGMGGTDLFDQKLSYYRIKL